MRIHVLSDLHLEFGDFEVPLVAVDLVVVAGDLHVGTNGVAWAAERLPDVPILYVLGNHEYYGGSAQRLAEETRRAAASVSERIVVLDRGSVRIDDVTFFGATLWTDFRLHGEPAVAMTEAADWMTDYRRIRVDPEGRRLRPDDVLAIHTNELEWLSDGVAEAQGTPFVIVTHHAPSARSLPERLTTDPLGPAYASDLDDFVRRSGARLWIHGHTHHAVDYRLGETRVVSNPRGYLGHDEVPGFVPDRVIEL